MNRRITAAARAFTLPTRGSMMDQASQTLKRSIRPTGSLFQKVRRVGWSMNCSMVVHVRGAASKRV
ncbi:hypothetical protein D3C86_2095150 [compost metagenome]